MRIIKNVSLAALLFASLASCDDFINDVAPAQSLDGSEIIGPNANAQGLTATLIGAYNQLQDSDYGATGLAINANILSDNGDWMGSFPSYRDMAARQMTANNGETGGLWEHAYISINQANLVLRGLDESMDPSLTDGVRANLEGQAKFLRGLAYFELVRYFGLPYGDDSDSDLGVPIVLSGVINPTDITFPSRATVEETYDQAISDLTDAQSLLGPTAPEGQASSLAATGFLAEIAFQQRRYEDANELAEMLINSPLLALESDPTTPFTTENSSEQIFAVVNTTQDNPGVNGSLPTFHHVNGRGGDVVVSDDLIQNGYFAVLPQSILDEAGLDGDTVVDLRVTELTSNGIFNIEKYEGFANNDDDNILLRLPTFYLMRAEILARMDGVNEESIELLNAIRSRAFERLRSDGAPVPNDIVLYDEDDFDDGDELIEAIIVERRVELAFEGNRLHDLRRLERDVRGLPFDDPTLVFPIPQRELDSNANLVQNPGY